MSEDDRSKRNEVFGARPAADQSMTTAQDALRADFGFEVPTELVPLPSNGLVYPQGSSLHGRETVAIKSMTAREEDILTSRALLKNGTVITELLRSSLVDKQIDPADLLVGDRTALMVAVRITGYGQEYDAELTCENDECELRTKRTFDLAGLAINRLSISPVEPGLNLFEFTLPYLKKVVKFRFLTGRDEEELSTTKEKMKKVGLSGDNANVTSNLLSSIVSVDGITDRAKIAQFVRVIPARDSLALRTYIKENEPGIVMRQESECPSCKHVSEVAIPLGVTFLWPGAQG